MQSASQYRMHGLVPMLKIRKIEHVAIAVTDIDAALVKYRDVFGLVAAEREVVASQKTEVVRLPVGESNLELIAPKGNESLMRFLDRRGPGLHHIAIEVEGIEEALAFLEGLGVALIDRSPRVGAGGDKVAFVHPSSTGGVLVELVDKGDK